MLRAPQIRKLPDTSLRRAYVAGIGNFANTDRVRRTEVIYDKRHVVLANGCLGTWNFPFGS